MLLKKFTREDIQNDPLFLFMGYDEKEKSKRVGLETFYAL
jgi:hypothetical protein